MEPSMWENIMTGLKGGAESSGIIRPNGGGANMPLISQILGQSAQALSTPGSWQSGVGGIGANLGTSQIAAKAAAKQSAERGAFTKQLLNILGGGTTSPGMEGLTGFKMGKDGKISFEADVDTPTFGGGTRLPYANPNLELSGTGSGGNGGAAPGSFDMSALANYPFEIAPQA